MKNKKILFVSLFVLSFLDVRSQVTQTEPQASVQWSTFAYPLSMHRQQHASIDVNVQLAEGIEADIASFYDTYVSERRLRISARLRKMLTNGLYIFAGSEIEGNLGKRLVPLGNVPRIGAMGGLGYDVDKNIMIEVKGNFSVNASDMGSYGEPLTMPRIYTLGSKMSF